MTFSTGAGAGNGFIERVRVEAASAWRPDDVGPEDAWSHTLSTGHVDGLLRFAAGGTVSGLSSALGGTVDRWRRILTHGPGFLRLRGFPTEGLSIDAIERAYLGLGSLVGVPMGQDRLGGLITHIRDEGRVLGAGVRRYQTNLSQDFHTDASDVVALLCLRPAESGGASKVVSAHTIYNEMLRRDPALLEVLYRPMPWSRHTESVEATDSHFELAPFTDVNGVPRVSVIPWFIRQSQAHASAPRLDSEQLAALDLFEAIMRSPELHMSMTFRSGDLQLLNNTLVLHARDAFTDNADPDRRRHLLRLWLGLERRVADDVLLSGGGRGGAGAQG